MAKGSSKKKIGKPRPMPIAPAVRKDEQPRTSTSTSAGARAPRSRGTSWWFDFAIDRHHLALLRFGFFAVLAVDCYLQLSHAPRYGAGDFNVGHFGWLPLPPPSRQAMVVIDLLLTYLCAMAALGVGTRIVVPLAAALFNYAYFVSQLDSYQHHYLVAMLLIIAAFVPWHAREPQVRSWALRLFTVQLALLYLWAALAKLEPRWLDGSALKLQLRPAWVRDLIGDHWALLAKAIVAGELTLAAAWLWRRGWPVALALGVGFHVSVELANFQIGQFSYLMLAIYTLAVPTVIAAWPGRALARLTARVPTAGLAIAAGALLVAIGGGVALLVLAPLGGGAIVIAASVAVAVAAFALRRTWTVGAAHLAACALILLLGHATDQVTDYYRLWAGSANRLGKPAEVRAASEALVALAPDHPSGNYYLGTMALQAGQLDDALARFRAGRRGNPKSPRLWIGEAKVQLARDDRDAARAAVDRALALDPGHREARALRAQLGGDTAPTPAPDGTGADAEDGDHE